ncbi:hypothetical protein HPB51_005246 [Rhipicephalus microplus]|uniref:tRNA:m(4)X modification enzyme TRM13 n=1 Tax=Rhipicephalus microplus TaxID=6941 RepID=A0A9J6E073_RHIMP|nr:hypothetical protein HPB51_005246 [Rhipicephalus microplus]
MNVSAALPSVKSQHGNAARQLEVASQNRCFLNSKAWAINSKGVCGQQLVEAVVEEINKPRMTAVVLQEHVEPIQLKNVSDERLWEIIRKVDEIYSGHVALPEKYAGLHRAFVTELEKLTGCAVAEKHLLQKAALLSLAESWGLLTGDSCFVEFGAGRVRNDAKPATAASPDSFVELINKFLELHQD